MATTPSPRSRLGSDSKKAQDTPKIVTRNGARKAKIQTRSVTGAKPSAALIAAKKKAQLKKKHSGDTIVRDHYQTAMDSKNQVKGLTGLTTEPRMLDHRCLWDLNYPECPERLSGILQRCKELDLLDQCITIPPRIATKDEVCTIHSPLVYEILENTHNCNNIDLLEEISSKYDAIYIHPSTHELALTSVGSTLDIVEAIVKKEIQNGVAFIRPPGHHAMKAEPCGYCFYNNVGLAAKHALENLEVNKILIVDWDVHHGQATQQMFYDDPRVVYFSIHRYEHGAFWPNLKQSDFNYIGCGEGTGYNFNVPLNKTQMQDADYLAIWHQLLLPMAFEFQPELVIVSAGYDAAIGCLEGEMEITPACYGHLTNMLMSICSSLCVVLEGGYCLKSLAEGAAITLRTLLGHPVPRVQPLTEPTESIKSTILNCIYAHKNYWNCYNYQQSYSIDATIKNVSDMLKLKHKVEVLWKGNETRFDRYETRNCYPKQSEKFLKNVAMKLDKLQLVTDLSIPPHSVCYVYDTVMLKHKNVCEPGHVESPERILRIHERHRDYGLLERLHIIEPRKATENEILLVHTKTHLNMLKQLSSTKLRDLKEQKESFNSVYLHVDSYESACVSAGCVLQMIDTILNGIGSSGVCVIRPPGHHAEEDLPCGFCLVNNVAIGAKYAVECHGLKRVLILDWDVHHGNGTQHIFESDNRVLYMSLHRYDNGSFFPNSEDADYKAVGKDAGLGFNVNIPWNKKGMSDAEYLSAFTQVILPIAYEFDPELVLISAGFDACVGDPLGGCKVSPECYGRFTQLMKGLANGKVILCLEGGYNTTSISYALTMCTKALLGDPISIHHQKLTYNQSAIESVNHVISEQKKFWKCLKFQEALPIEDVLGPLAPSRGLIVNVDNVDKSTSSSKTDTSVTFDISFNQSVLSNIRKSNTSFDESFELKMHKLRLTSSTECDDGIHCGTDDDDDDDNTNVDRRVTRSRVKSTSELEKNVTPGNSLVTILSTDQVTPTSVSSGRITRSKSRSSPNEPGTSLDKRVTVSSNASKKETLVDYLSSNMQALINEEMYAVVPMPWCPHLNSLYVIPPNQKFEQGVKCINCNNTQENWICLHCYTVACARYVNAHMLEHFKETDHPLVLSLTDLSVWCNKCDAYVDNALLYDAKNLAHRAKFGEDMPWCYGGDNSITME